MKVKIVVCKKEVLKKIGDGGDQQAEQLINTALKSYMKICLTVANFY